MREINHSFHNKMGIQLIHIAKILEISIREYSGDKNEISFETGIPTGQGSGKVVPHIEFARSMGLIEYEKDKGIYRLKATALGKLVYEQDPYMLLDVTKWVCNYWLTDESIGIPQWYYFMRGVPVILGQEQDTKFIESKIQSFFDTAIYIGVTYSTYTNDCFEELNLIDYDKSKQKVVFNELTSKVYCKYVYAYTLLKSWENLFPSLQEITIHQIVDEMKWGRPFGFTYEEVLIVLDEIVTEGYITLNKQLSPMTIIKTQESERILANLYDLVM